MDDKALFTVRKQYNAMLQAQIDAMRKMNDEDEAGIAAFEDVQATYAAKVGIWTGAENMVDFGRPIIRERRRNIARRLDHMMNLHREIAEGMFKPATPWIVEEMQSMYPEWLEVVIPDGSVDPVDVVVFDAAQIVEAATAPVCCGKWVVFDPRDVATASCGCAYPANDVEAINAFLDDYDALFGERLAA